MLFSDAQHALNTLHVVGMLVVQSLARQNALDWWLICLMERAQLRCKSSRKVNSALIS